MLRAFSTRNGRQGTTSYEKLHGEPDMGLLLESKLDRSRSYPPPSSRISNNKVDQVQLAVPVKASSSGKKVEEVKGHPLFSLFTSRRKKKKITARPEFARYLEYVREGGAGVWGAPPPSNGPISYK